jgi:hypothetical protein
MGRTDSFRPRRDCALAGPASPAFDCAYERMKLAGIRSTFEFRSGGLFVRPPMMSRARFGSTIDPGFPAMPLDGTWLWL